MNISLNLILSLQILLALNFATVDRLFSEASSADGYAACRTALEQMLPQAETHPERAQVEWRLARVCLLLEAYADGIGHAQEAIRLDPSNENGYMWHCANVGRESQQHSLATQAKRVPIMEKDLTTILDELGKTAMSEAWQALSELYWAHPFKSNESAINFARRAAVTIPAGELRLSTYLYLAGLLHERNWSASKRDRQRSAHAAGFADKSKTPIARYACYDGAPAGEWPWKSAGLSDREEAIAILQHARALYRKETNPQKIETTTYNLIMKQLELWK